MDRTINVLATALRAGMTVHDLEHLELAYAPPYGSAKDPVNIAGFVASNRLRGDSDLADWRQVQTRDPERQVVLDVRTALEYEMGHIDGAVHIPNTQLRQRLGELASDKEWIVCCAVGRRAYVMERMLKQHGLRARTLTGGWTTYHVATEEQGNLADWHGDGVTGSDDGGDTSQAREAPHDVAGHGSAGPALQGGGGIQPT